jgi:UDPglucose 6-dehydrogenase
MKNKKLIGFVGLSHLSLSYSLASAKRGYQIVMYDFNSNLMNKFKNYHIDFNEKSLLQKFKSYRNFYDLKNNIKNLNKCRLIFISLDVKTDRNNKADYSKIKKYINLLNKKLNKKIPFIIQSQLYPGFCNNLKLGSRDIYYQVETLIFGKAFYRAYKPDRIIVGYKNSKKFNNFYFKYLSSFKCPIIKMNYYSAELSKIAINIFLSSSLTVANTFARISEIIGSNYKDIELALRSDNRIGLNSYLSAGLGISGGNLERDLYLIKKFLNKNNINSDFINSIIKNSKVSKNWIIKTFLKIHKKYKVKKVSLVGLSYKKNNSSLKNSPSVLFLKTTNKLNLKVKIYDDLIDEYNGKDISDIQNVIKNPDIVIFARDFVNSNLIVKKFFNKKNKLKFCIDPFNLVKDKYINNFKTKVFQIGKN